MPTFTQKFLAVIAIELRFNFATANSVFAQDFPDKNGTHHGALPAWGI